MIPNQRIEELLEMYSENEKKHNEANIAFNFERYENLKIAIKKEINYECQKIISKVSYVQSFFKDKFCEIELLDYRVPFSVDYLEDEKGFRRMSEGSQTDYKEIIQDLITDKYEHFNQIQTRILASYEYFSVSDVTIRNGIAPYQNELKNAIKIAKKLCLFDSKGYATPLNKLISKSFEEKPTFKEIIIFLNKLLNDEVNDKKVENFKKENIKIILKLKENIGKMEVY
jgi:hypothetical protein